MDYLQHTANVCDVNLNRFVNTCGLNLIDINLMFVFLSFSILNKLTPEKFDRLVFDLINLGINSKNILKGIILLVCIKRISFISFIDHLLMPRGSKSTASFDIPYSPAQKQSSYSNYSNYSSSSEACQDHQNLNSFTPFPNFAANFIPQIIIHP